jgi:23S rRNA pseudouridine1911/1915/1917 synthase
LTDHNRIKIIYEDNHLLAVEKPVNIPSQKDESNDSDMLSILKDYIKNKYNKQGEVYLGLVHRLDRPVGGVMVFARTSKAASRLSEQIRTHVFEKSYFAVIHGVPKEPEGTMEHYLLKDRASNIVKAVEPDTSGAKYALLDYKLIETADDLSLVLIQLHTGRSHQIRVQFSQNGNPLYGDQKYGMGLNKAGMQIALWSSQITLQHPTLGTAMVFRSSPPGVKPWDSFRSLHGGQNV